MEEPKACLHCKDGVYYLETARSYLTANAEKADFCPHCGRPLTDKGREILARRAAQENNLEHPEPAEEMNELAGAGDLIPDLLGTDVPKLDAVSERPTGNSYGLKCVRERLMEERSCRESSYLIGHADGISYTLKSLGLDEKAES